MKPPEDLKPEGMLDWVKEQKPWLKNPSNPIPTVNPDDLKSLWKLQNDLEAKYGKPERKPGETTIIIGGDIVKGALSSVADLDSARYRLSWLFWLQTFSEAGLLEFPWIHNGEPDDAVFKALAIVPMTGMPSLEGECFPFNGDELKRLIQKESGAEA